MKVVRSLKSYLVRTVGPLASWKDNRDFLLSQMPKGSVCAEVGVWRGGFSEQILKTVKPKKLHLIDPWKFLPEYKERWYGGSLAKSQKDMDRIYLSVQARFKGEKRIVIHRDFSHSVAKKFKDNYFDWIYIDGNHSYEFVKKDLELYLPKIKRGGYITGDDCLWWKKFLGFEVKRAVDEFLTKGLVEEVSVSHGQYILRRI